MNSLNELIGVKVEFDTYKGDDEDDQITLRGKVESVNIDDFYFEDKQEPIYITVFVRPDENSYNHVVNGVADYDLEETLTSYFGEVPIENIRKSF